MIEILGLFVVLKPCCGGLRVRRVCSHHAVFCVFSNIAFTLNCYFISNSYIALGLVLDFPERHHFLIPWWIFVCVRLCGFRTMKLSDFATCYSK
jgi:hypothetical protein